MRGTELPDSIRMGQRLTGMTAYQAKFPTAPSIFKFAQHGRAGTWLSELLPHTAKDRRRHLRSSARCRPTPSITIPAVTFFQTGFQLAGRPSIGSWISYGLGSENKDLPAFVVMVSQGGGNSQALADRQWGSGFLPTRYQGVKFRSGADPVLYLSNPPGYSGDARRRFLDDLAKLNELKLQGVSGPGDRDPHRAVRDGVPDAKLGAGTDGSFEGAGIHLRDVRSGFAQAGHLRRQLHPGAPAGRARRALHPALPSRLGPAQQSAAARSADSACRPTSPRRR